MTDITFHGGVNDIGGNKFLVEDKGTKILMDFGMSFGDEGKFFSQFMNARTSNSLADLFELGIFTKTFQECIELITQNIWVWRG